MSGIHHIAVDWGSSSFRIWALAADGRVVGQNSGPHGALSLQPNEFEPLLESQIAALGGGADLPVIICGMAGGAQGWYQAPYLPTPAPLDQLFKNTVMVPEAKRPVHIIPGVAQDNADEPDVMRGEETLIFGALPSGPLDGPICMPGTHSKWVTLHGQNITGFKTIMTGELFALLSTRASLAPMIETDQHDADAFARALCAAADDPALALTRLFTLRAGPLVHGAAETAKTASTLSGLLIGAEIGLQKITPDTTVHLIAAGVLAERYETAFNLLNINTNLIDAEALAHIALHRIALDLFEQEPPHANRHG